MTDQASSHQHRVSPELAQASDCADSKIDDFKKLGYGVAAWSGKEINLPVYLDGLDVFPPHHCPHCQPDGLGQPLYHPEPECYREHRDDRVLLVLLIALCVIGVALKLLY